MRMGAFPFQELNQPEPSHDASLHCVSLSGFFCLMARDAGFHGWPGHNISMEMNLLWEDIELT